MIDLGPFDGSDKSRSARRFWGLREAVTTVTVTRSMPTNKKTDSDSDPFWWHHRAASVFALFRVVLALCCPVLDGLEELASIEENEQNIQSLSPVSWTVLTGARRLYSGFTG